MYLKFADKISTIITFHTTNFKKKIQNINKVELPFEREIQKQLIARVTWFYTPLQAWGL